MKRNAIVAPASLGALEVYRTVIRDISEVLGDPTIDMAKLFFALMIQSGLQRFSLPEGHSSDLSKSSLLSDRLCDINLERIGPTLAQIRIQVDQSVKAPAASNEDSRIVSGVASFLQDLYLAAEFRRPVATVLEKPAEADVHRLLREDAAMSISALLAAVRTVSIETPVARYEALESDLKSFQVVMASDAFEPYAASHSMFESISQGESGIVSSVREHGRNLARSFPSLTDLRQTAVRTVDAIPSILDATAGKVFGAAAKPFVSALSDALGRDQRILLYSFYPAWREIWNGKLEKARSMMRKERGF